jgi:GTPase SAR1 family protein
VYDVTRAATFNTLKSWVRELQELGPENIVIAICGSKSDLAARREVDPADARAYAESIGAIFIETSAKDNRNVKELFVDLSRRLPPPVQDPSDFNDLPDLRNERKRGGSGGSGNKSCC